MTFSFSHSSKVVLSLVYSTQTAYCWLKEERIAWSGNTPSHATFKKGIQQLYKFQSSTLFEKKFLSFLGSLLLVWYVPRGFWFQCTHVERCALCHLVRTDKKETVLDSDWCWISRVHHSWQGGSRPVSRQPSFTSRDFCTSPVSCKERTLDSTCFHGRPLQKMHLPCRRQPKQMKRISITGLDAENSLLP